MTTECKFKVGELIRPIGLGCDGCWQVDAEDCDLEEEFLSFGPETIGIYLRSSLEDAERHTILVGDKLVSIAPGYWETLC